MDEQYKSIIQRKLEKEAQRDTEYKRESKRRLETIIKTKMTTTMIGALDAIEKNFGFLWDSDSDEAIHMKNVFDDVRKQILDNGNKQIKSVQEELKRYDIEWLRYETKMTVATNKAALDYLQQKLDEDGKNG